MKIKFCIFLIFISLVFVLFENQAYGHGTTAEIMPSQIINGKNVTLMAIAPDASNFDDVEKKAHFRLFETETNSDIINVTFFVELSKNDKILFSQTLQDDTGNLWLIFTPNSSDEVTIEEEILYSYIGDEKIEVGKAYRVNGADLQSRGLYEFSVEILTIDDYSKKLDEPISYEFGLSYPVKTNHIVDDINFGKQELSLISYYDQIHEFEFDPKDQSIRIDVPFVWTEKNIRLTSLIHEEIQVPKSYGDYFVPDMYANFNDLELKDSGLVIDDSIPFYRTIHLVVNQNQLMDLVKKENKQKGIAQFKLVPNTEKLLRTTVTQDYHYTINLSWKPLDLKSSSNVSFFIEILDNFRNRIPAEVNFDVSIYNNDSVIFENSGSTGSDGIYIVDFDIPEHVTGPITLVFQNVNNSILGTSQLALVVNRIANDSRNNDISEMTSIPNWIRNNAGWWAENSIGDADFVQGIQFLIKEKIILIPDSSKSSAAISSSEIPSWIKNNAKWWSKGQIDDNSFVKGIQFLIENGIIRI